MRSICKPLLVVAFVGTVVAVPALAQQPRSYPPPCDASKVSKADVDRAHTVFLSGKQFLDESNYDKAISYFNDAYSIDCSVHAHPAHHRDGVRAQGRQGRSRPRARGVPAPRPERARPRARRAPHQEPERPARARGPAPSASAAAAERRPPLRRAPTRRRRRTAPARRRRPPSPARQPTVEPRRRSAVPWIVSGVGGAVAHRRRASCSSSGAATSRRRRAAARQRMGCIAPSSPTGQQGRTLETVGGVVGVRRHRRGRRRVSSGSFRARRPPRGRAAQGARPCRPSCARVRGTSARLDPSEPDACAEAAASVARRARRLRGECTVRGAPFPAPRCAGVRLK